MHYLINLVYILQTLVKRLYSFKSAGDKGTLFQLKELVHRTSFGKDPKHNLKATEDFLETVVFAHITAAAMEIIEREKNSLTNFHELYKRIVSDFVKITVPPIEATSDARNTVPSNEATSDAGDDVVTENAIHDSVYTYAVDLLTMGLFWYAYQDAVREGDGDRIMEVFSSYL